jgi:hypothetical protein
MGRRGLKRLAPIAGALLATAGIAAIPVGAVAGASGASTTCSSSAGKCYALTITPTSVAAGSSTTFDFTFTNEATTQQLGSAEITAPSGLTITGAAVAPGYSGSGVVNSSTSALFTSLNLAPGASTEVEVTATASCGGTTYSWPAPEVKQSNDFNGPPGNDFAFDSANSGSLSGSVNGSCSLGFVTGTEPQSTTAGSYITSVFDSGHPTTEPVEVQLFDGNGNPLTSSSAPVTLTLAANPGSAKSLDVTVDAVSGVASFVDDLSIDAAGIGYELAATSPGFTGTPPSPYSSTSSPFTILGSLTQCSSPSGSCTTSGNGKDTSFSASATIPVGDYLGVGFGGVSNFSCGSYVGVPLADTSDIANYEVLDTTGTPVGNTVSTVSEEISKSTVQQSGHQGASTWQICYGSTTPDANYVSGTTSSQVIGGASYYFGLLPDCSSTVGAPCVSSRNKDNAGDVVIQFQATDSVWRP